MASPQYTFGAYTFNPTTGELRKHDISVKLQRKPQQVLVALLERAGEPVSRPELHVRLWHGDTFVDFEQGLNVAVKKLRDALCDSADEPRYVQTVPGIGYRFIGQLEGVPAAIQQPAAAPVTVSASAPAVSAEFEKPNLSTMNWTRRFRASVALISAAVLAIALFAASSSLRHGHAKPMRVTLSFEPDVRMVTIGDEAGLALSPDGRRVVFSAMDASGRTKLWLRRLDVLQPEPLPGTESGSFPFWAPTGDKLGFFADAKLKWLDLAYQAQTSGSDEVYVSSYPEPTLTYRISTNGGSGPRWRGDGHELYFLGSGKAIFAVPVSSLGTHLKLGEPRWLFQPRLLPEPWDRLSYDVDRSGKRFVMSTVDPKDRSELVLVTDWNQ
jgi:DNA-binding winged helix-turn-helix (wHTH) protein